MVDYTILDDSVLKEKNQERVTSVEKFESRSWDQDNIAQRVSEVQNNSDTIETILQDIDEQLESLPSEEDLKEEWKPWLDRQETDNRGNAKSLPRAFYDAEKERSKLLLRQAVWQARLKELERFARQKLAEKFDQLLKQYRTAKSYDTLEEVLENKAEHFAEQKIEKKSSEFEGYVNQMEKMGQAFREEKRSLWRMIERVAEEDTNSISKDEVEEVMVEGLNQFVLENGMFTLDEDELDQDQKESEREGLAEKQAENIVSPDSSEKPTEKTSEVYEIKGKDTDVQNQKLSQLAEEYSPLENDWTQQEVADKTDVSAAAIFKDGGILDRIHDRDWFPGVDVRGR